MSSIDQGGEEKKVTKYKKHKILKMAILWFVKSNNSGIKLDFYIL